MSALPYAFSAHRMVSTYARRFTALGTRRCSRVALAYCRSVKDALFSVAHLAETSLGLSVASNGLSNTFRIRFCLDVPVTGHYAAMNASFGFERSCSMVPYSGMDSLRGWREAAASTCRGHRLKINYGRILVPGLSYVLALPAAIAAQDVAPAAFDGPVTSIAVDSSTGLVVVGGAFASVNGLPAANIAVYKDGAWTSLGEGTDNTVNDVAIFDGSIVAGGEFFSASGADSTTFLAEWKEDSWRSVGSIENGRVTAIATGEGTLVVGGHFFEINGARIEGIGRFDGEAWEPLGAGIWAAFFEPDANPWSIEIVGDSVLVGGDVSSASGSVFRYLGLWDGNEWLSFGEPNGIATVVHVGDAGHVYVGGGFTSIGGVQATRVAYWDGDNWHPMSDGFNSHPSGIAASGGRLFMGGSFGASGTTALNYLAEWKAGEWIPVGTGTNSDIRALAVSGDQLLIGGTFTTFNDEPAGYFAIHDVSSTGSTDHESSEADCQPQIYPNPSNGIFRIKGLDDGRHSIAVSDAVGRRVSREEVRSAGGYASLDLSALPAGRYLIEGRRVHGGGPRCRTLVVISP